MLALSAGQTTREKYKNTVTETKRKKKKKQIKRGKNKSNAVVHLETTFMLRHRKWMAEVIITRGGAFFFNNLHN